MCALRELAGFVVLDVRVPCVKRLREFPWTNAQIQRETDWKFLEQSHVTRMGHSLGSVGNHPRPSTPSIRARQHASSIAQHKSAGAKVTQSIQKQWKTTTGVRTAILQTFNICTRPAHRSWWQVVGEYRSGRWLRNKKKSFSRKRKGKKATSSGAPSLSFLPFSTGKCRPKRNCGLDRSCRINTW